jgi:prepilin-type processing-associated H-X9-DG protein
MNRTFIGTLLKLAGTVGLVAAVIFLLSGPAKPERRWQRINCVSNLKQIGIGFRLWQGDHGDQYPFNLSTNAGGAMEWSAVDTDGFDGNAYLYLRTMTDELTTPKLLICPQDRSKRTATNWANLRTENISYRFHSGTNYPQAVLAVCPIHGNLLFCDGSVKEVKAAPPPGILDELNDRVQHDQKFQIRLATTSVIMAAGLGLFLVGGLLARKAANPAAGVAPKASCPSKSEP